MNGSAIIICVVPDLILDGSLVSDDDQDVVLSCVKGVVPDIIPDGSVVFGDFPCVIPDGSIVIDVLDIVPGDSTFLYIISDVILDVFIVSSDVQGVTTESSVVIGVIP